MDGLRPLQKSLSKKRNKLGICFVVFIRGRLNKSGVWFPFYPTYYYYYIVYLENTFYLFFAKICLLNGLYLYRQC